MMQVVIGISVADYLRLLVTKLLFYIEFFLYNCPIYQNKQEPSCEYPKKRSPLMMCC